MPQPFDSTVVRAWVTLALEAIGEGREEIDAINVFPVADGDTGTNLHRTVDAAAQGIERGADGPAAPVLRALARGALLGACGNSGTILAQLLRGMAEVYGEAEAARQTRRAEETGAGGTAAEGSGDAQVDGDGRLLAGALRRAAESAYEAVARPVEGTMLTVARAAAEAAGREAADHADAPPATVARAAHEGARAALAATTGQLDVLRRAGVVDAGGSGLVAVLGALADVLADPGAASASASRPRTSVELQGHGEGAAGPSGTGPSDKAPSDQSPAYEVMYLLDADDD
ncbi:MAG TPA: DAK2 domain-containing protein, partial [Streptomyces sp.]|nr:DAK2 domain-containing protein [Streptomyces sp.]